MRRELLERKRRVARSRVREREIEFGEKERDLLETDEREREKYIIRVQLFSYLYICFLSVGV